MRIAIKQQWSLQLGEGLVRAVQHLLLTPQNGATQTVHEWQIEVAGLDEAEGFIDAFGNRAHLATQTRPEPELVVSVEGLVETHDRNGVVGRLERDPVPALFRRVTPLTKPIGAIVGRFRSAPRDGQERIALLHALMERVGEVLSAAQSQAQEGQSQSQGGPVEARDHAHAFIGAARALEIPARYVTGYLAGADDAPTSFHAWAEAWDDRLGWIGFDTTLNECPTDRHVRVACGLDAISTAPIRSVPAIGAPQILTMRVDIAQ